MPSHPDRVRRNYAQPLKDPKSGLSIRFVRSYDIKADQRPGSFIVSAARDWFEEAQRRFSTSPHHLQCPQCAGILLHNGEVCGTCLGLGEVGYGHGV